MNILIEFKYLCQESLVVGYIASIKVKPYVSDLSFEENKSIIENEMKPLFLSSSDYMIEKPLMRFFYSDKVFPILEKA